MGYWNGDVPVPDLAVADPWLRAERLQPDARAVVLDHEAMSVFQAMPVDETTFAVKAFGSPIISMTPAGPQKLAEQMAEVRTAMDLRADRLPEILAQQGDMLSFFGAMQTLNNDRRRRTMLLLSVIYGAVVSQEMRIKHFCSTPRPMDLSAQVQPVIQTPGHSAYPSGHATEAFAFATVLSALRLANSDAAKSRGLIPALLEKLTPAMESATAADPDLLMFRLASRIADNRTVAGVHYPVDSAHGAVLGLSTALALIAHCLGGGAKNLVPTWAVKADSWSGDFTLRKWIGGLGEVDGAGLRGESVALPTAATWHLLPRLWTLAAAEW